MAQINFQLNDKVVLISGASSGIGRACAIRCAEAGADLILVARNEERLLETCSHFPSSTRYHLILADLSSAEFPEDGLNAGVQKLGKVSGMIHSAGISTTLPLRNLTEKKLLEFYKVNVVSATLLAKWFAKSSNYIGTGGSIVWMASVMGIVGESGKTTYSLTKGALIAGARTLAIELASKKIRVNCVSPGVVVTPMTKGAVYSQTDETKEHIESLHPLGLGTPDDIAYTCIYLLSDASRWITGINLAIDGGYTAR